MIAKNSMNSGCNTQQTNTCPSCKITHHHQSPSPPVTRRRSSTSVHHTASSCSSCTCSNLPILSSHTPTHVSLTTAPICVRDMGQSVGDMCVGHGPPPDKITLNSTLPQTPQHPHSNNTPVDGPVAPDMPWADQHHVLFPNTADHPCQTRHVQSQHPHTPQCCLSVAMHALLCRRYCEGELGCATECT